MSTTRAGTARDRYRASTSQDHVQAKDHETSPSALNTPHRSKLNEGGADGATSMLERLKDCDSPQLPFLQKNTASHLRFNGDDTKSFSSEFSVSSGRTPSEASSTPSDMKPKKCHVCSKFQTNEYLPLVRCTGCKRRYHSGCHKPPIIHTGSARQAVPP